MKKLLSLLTATALCVFLLSGCVFPIGNVTTVEPVDNHEVTVMQLTLEKAENPVKVHIKGSEDFEGLKDIINGSTVARMGDKHLISEVLRCADFGDHYGGSYTVKGNHLENTTVCFQTRAQEWGPITCGVNYYDLIVEASAMTCDEVHIAYGNEVTMTKVSGDFSIFLFTLSESSPMQFGAEMMEVFGTAEEGTTLSLTWDAEQFRLTADKRLAAVQVVAAPNDEELRNTLDLPESSGAYTFRFQDGVPVSEGMDA